MKVFIEAFVDTNFGDSLFVHTVVTRYPDCTFYMSVNDAYERSYRILEQQETNIRLISACEEESYLPQMDGLIFVGGDMFWNWGHYESYIQKVKTIKDHKGFVIFLGQSLFADYSFETRMELGKMFSRADCIVMREQASYEQVRRIAPFTKAIASTDMAFTVDVKKFQDIQVEKGVLGISVRKKIPRETPDAYEQYCIGMAQMASGYLKKSKDHQVRFLALSTGAFDDAAVVQDIMGRCTAEQKERMNCVAFDGSVDAYIEEIQRCERLVCTRFHALVFGILLGKTIVPIIYEDKMERLLDAVSYNGIRIKYEDVLDASMKEDITACEDYGYTLSAYMDGAKHFFDVLDKKMRVPRSSSNMIRWGLYQGYYFISRIMHILFAKVLKR